RSACLNPSKFHNQIAPTNIQISCRDTLSKWVPDADGAMTMNTGRQVVVSVMSDKYTSNAESGTLPMKEQVATCPKFKQVLETVETVRAVSCEDLAAFSGPAVDFCANAVNMMKSANPEVIKSQETGEVVDFCAGVSRRKDWRDQKEDRGQKETRAQKDSRGQRY
ncbi:MAG: hypothetical protein K2X47_20120, partial [Bdellovibrionales bacterium]|nr:hypothetical protein [Bdellovibrionales bacterium]